MKARGRRGDRQDGDVRLIYVARSVVLLAGRKLTGISAVRATYCQTSSALVSVMFGNSVVNTTNLHGNCIIDVAQRETVRRSLQIRLPKVIKEVSKCRFFTGIFS